MSSPIDVTDAERTRYATYVATDVFSVLHPHRFIFPNSLWHYTSGDGLIGIVQSGEFWLTQSSCMNDATEIRHGISLAVAALQRFRPQIAAGSVEAALVDQVILNLSSGDAAPTSYWFTGSFSVESDDLSQWRAYGGGEGGYAIEFDYSSMLSILQGVGSIIAPVCYDIQQQEKACDVLARATVQFYKDGLMARPGGDPAAWGTSFLECWDRTISYLTPLVKHPKFASEKEWRILYQLKDSDYPNMQFRQRQSMMVRHLPVRLGTGPNLPILSVCVGPSRHKEISKVGVGTLLRTMNYRQAVYDNVHLTEVPYQS